MYGPHGLPMHSLGLFGFDTHDCSLSNQDSSLPPVATDTTLSLFLPCSVLLIARFYFSLR